MGGWADGWVDGCMHACMTHSLIYSLGFCFHGIKTDGSNKEGVSLKSGERGEEVTT